MGWRYRRYGRPIPPHWHHRHYMEEGCPACGGPYYYEVTKEERIKLLEEYRDDIILTCTG